MASKSFELRRAVVADAAAIRELTREAYSKWIPVIGREPMPMTADYDEAVRKNRFDLLYVEGKLAALIETIAQADGLLIENVAVSPFFQGRGPRPWLQAPRRGQRVRKDGLRFRADGRSLGSS